MLRLQRENNFAILKQKKEAGMEQFLQQLHEMELFGKIEKGQIGAMLQCLGAVAKDYAKGEFIFLEGESLDSVGVVMSGSVQMIKEDVWGQKAILLSLEPGAVFGESFVCGGGSDSTVSFQAAQNSRILLLGFHKVLRTCSSSCIFHHRLIENMVTLLARKNVQLMDKMEVISKKSIRGRILVWLSQQVQRRGSRKFTSSMGRLELADYLCVDRSALTRELGRMQEEGLVLVNKNEFELLMEA
ncbi:Crp/Fnr family transcriptional regulator [Clostridium sp. AF18-27]|nr:Crp/Fnr family transcriptional regulator [Enterocloster asparagiformis]PST29926.1 Crp/Fnr family transcriptional regulator [Enterocloster lavalensis]RHR51386.1 Crp/Fnr family transcriptional regulator [Clostridium sp. AF18-27]